VFPDTVKRHEDCGKFKLIQRAVSVIIRKTDFVELLRKEYSGFAKRIAEGKSPLANLANDESGLGVVRVPEAAQRS
jgi:hypothetical protein